MTTDRREFLGTMVAGVVAGRSFGRLSPAELEAGGTGSAMTGAPRADWDVSWTSRVNGTYRAVFDSPELAMGLGMLRALIWKKDYGEVYGTKPADMSAVVVLRHNAIWAVMNDEFWAHHGVGQDLKITDPATAAPIARNPFIGAFPFPGFPPGVADDLLTRTIASATVLACNLAFQDVVEKAKAHTGGDEARAREMALAHIVPGIILQPSGVFAVLRAQDAGCKYLMAS